MMNRARAVRRVITQHFEERLSLYSFLWPVMSFKTRGINPDLFHQESAIPLGVVRWQQWRRGCDRLGCGV